MQITIRTKGLTDIIKNLNDVNVRREFVKAANESIAVVNKQAISEVPVDSSQLQKSHIVKPARMTKTSAEVYTELKYSVPVHEGHRLVAWGRETGRRIKANPWMERAATKSRANATQSQLSHWEKFDKQSISIYSHHRRRVSSYNTANR